MLKRLFALSLALVASLPAAGANPAPKGLSPAEVERLVTATMAEFRVPGIAIGVVRNGALVYAQGFGVQEIGKPALVNPATNFGIGSNTKAFTAAALALLVDEGKLHWDDKVNDHLPQFRLYDPYVTREFTVRDLLTHRSGLGLGAGDLMFVPVTDFSRSEVLHNLRYLKPASSFRSKFDYDNLLYLVAGELIPAITGESWEHFVNERILVRLGMTGCDVGMALPAATTNRASPHVVVNDQLGSSPELNLGLVGAAGAIRCNIHSLSRWVITQLASGKDPDGQMLFSTEQAHEMWTPHTLLPVDGGLNKMTHTHFQTYGLGWFIDDFDGFQRISHNGGVPGMVTHIGMLPELQLGIIVLTNQEDGYALTVLSHALLEGYATTERHDWLALLRKVRQDREADSRAADARRAPAGVPMALSAAERAVYAGRFVDAWRGAVSISEAHGQLRLTFSRTQGLQGTMAALGNDLFVVTWDDRSLHADAYARFTRDFSGKPVGFSMQPVSELTDFSYDFGDLDFRREELPAPRAQP